MNTLRHTWCLFGFIGLPLCAQVSVNKPIVLQGEVRRVEGLAPSTAPAEALTGGIAQQGVVHHATPEAGNNWVVEHNALGQLIPNGAYLVFAVPATDSSAVTIAVNGEGPFPVLHENHPLHGDRLVEGTVLTVVHANGAFHVLNGNADLRRACPSGMVAVNELYCIEPQERGGGDYFQAGLACAAQGRRLCSWGELIAACQRSLSLQLIGMTNNWEWTNSTANEDNVGRIANLNSCESAATWLATGSGPVAYRCCYSR